MHNPFKIYIAASFRHKHAVQMLARQLQGLDACVEILDWTTKATPPAGLDAQARKAWMDTDHEDCGKSVFAFCRDACASADLVIYFGASGQDAGVEVGIAYGSGVEVIGLAGTLESPGLMLNGVVSEWALNPLDLMSIVGHRIMEHKGLTFPVGKRSLPITGLKD